MRRETLITAWCFLLLFGVLFPVVESHADSADFIRGNANGDAVVDLSDAVFIIRYLFAGAQAGCLKAMDANDDGILDLADVVRLLDALFVSAWPLPAPSLACGQDPTPDDLTCLEGSVACPALLSVRIESGTRVAVSGDAVAYDLFYPVPRRYARPPYPAGVLTHGFARSKERMRANAVYLAERGMLVLTPNLLSLLGGEADQIRNIENTADHVRWLIARGRSPGDPIEGLVDPERIGLAGHSAGGAVTQEAALALQRSGDQPAAVCLLDAVPWDRTLDTAPQLQALAFLSLRSEPSSCNASGSVRSLLGRFSFPVEDVRIVGASHCDPENPTDALCTLFCGGTSGSRRTYYQRLMFLFFKDALGVPLLESPPQTYAAFLAELDAAGAVVREPRGGAR